MMNTSKVCRLCANSKLNCIDIYSEEGCRLLLSSQIKQYLKITVNPGDVLPTAVCRGCCARLLELSRFCEETSQAQKILQLSEIPTSSPLHPNNAAQDVFELCCPISESPKYLASDSAERGSMPCESNTSESTDGAQKPCTTFPWHCTDCSSVLSSVYELQMHHQEIHQQSVRFQCFQCPKVFLVYCKFSRHVRQHLSEGKFRCDTCKRAFSSKQALCNHLVLHSDVVESFACEECGRIFKKAVSLQRHERVHRLENTQELSCPQCGKTFSSRQALHYHMRVHEGVKEFMCETCGKVFSTRQVLHRHAMSHLGERPHVCHTCHKPFKTRYQLCRHEVTHTEEREYQCEVCGRRFRQRSTLILHGRVHTGLTPYRCEICGHSFRFRGNYVIHRRQHTGEHPYSCSDCGWAFSCFANYSKHRKRRHPSASCPLAHSEDQVSRSGQPAGLELKAANTSSAFSSHS